MRSLATPSASFLRWRSLVVNTHRLIIQRSNGPLLSSGPGLSSRSLAQVRIEPLSELWFTSSSPSLHSPADDLLGFPGNGKGRDHKPPDERTVKLGKTLRTLSPLLPNILTTPLPQDILSSSISLHLFPSTHPHLPAVKGKVPYQAGLWTAPVAWGCVPLVGNVKLQIVSEKIVRTGFVTTPHENERADLGEEKLVVRWKTEKKKISPSGSAASSSSTSTTTSTATTDASAARSSAADSTSTNGSGGINRGLSALLGGDKPIFNLNKDDDFTGLFIFSFDTHGRIATHTIEHADESNGFDKTAKVLTLTDWLLGKARWGRAGGNREEELIPGLAMRVCRNQWPGERRQNLAR